MKERMFKILLLSVAVLLVGCTRPEMKKFTVDFKDAGPGYITMVATVPTATSVYYYLSEVEAPGLTSEMLAKNGESEVFYKDGEQQLLGYDIKENTKYYLYLVASLANYSYSDLYKFEFTTGSFNFDQLATIVGVLPDGYKVHLKMPESVRNSVDGTAEATAIRYSHANVMMYNLRNTTSDDYQHLLYNGGNHVRKDTTIVFSDETNWGSVGYDANGDGVIDENDKGVLWDYVAPGEPLVFVAGEFQWMQEPEDLDPEDNHVIDGFFYPAGWQPGYYLPKLDSAKYWSIYDTKTKGAGIIRDFDMSSPIDDAWTGAFQRKVFRTRMPDKIDADIQVEIEDLRSVDANIIITPDPRLYRYVFAILDDASYKLMLEDYLDMQEDYLQWAVSSYFAMMNFGASAIEAGANQTSAPPVAVQLSKYFYDVPADTKYHVLITGMAGAEISAPQCFKHFTFSTPPKTKSDGPTIEVKALEEQTTANFAAFNIKCTSTADNIATRCYYGANYYKDWVLAVNKGSSYETLGQTTQFDETDLAKINSEEGLTVMIPSIDGETTRLVVVAFNDENISNGIDKVKKENVINHPAVEDCTTPYITLSDDKFLEGAALLDNPVLDGEWTLTATVSNGGKTEINRSKVNFKRRFTAGVDYPSTLPDSVKAIYKDETKWTDGEIIGHFEKFVELSNVFNTKRLRGQNKILLEGWLDNDSQKRLSYMTPWDMFVSRTISTVDVESMFSDFGPKLLFEAFKDQQGRDSLALTSDRYFASPVAGWSVPFYLAGRRNAETNNTVFYYGDEYNNFVAPLEFPVVLSEDRDTITIKPIRNKVSEGVYDEYYPNLIGIDESNMSGTYILEKPIISEVVLTRGWTDEPVQDESEPVVKSGAGRRASCGVSTSQTLPRVVYKHRTIFAEPVPMVKVEGNVMTVEKVRENLEKFSKNHINAKK